MEYSGPPSLSWLKIKRWLLAAILADHTDPTSTTVTLSPLTTSAPPSLHVPLTHHLFITLLNSPVCIIMSSSPSPSAYAPLFPSPPSRVFLVRPPESPTPISISHVPIIPPSPSLTHFPNQTTILRTFCCGVCEKLVAAERSSLNRALECMGRVLV